MGELSGRVFPTLTPMRGSHDHRTASTRAEPAGPARPLRKEPHRPHHRLQRPAAGVAAAVLRAARHLLPGAGGGRRGDDGPSLPRGDQPRRRGRGARADGHGHHLVHGKDLRCAPQPGREHRLFALRRDFPWWRVPGYVIPQLAGATLAALFLREVINVSAKYGGNYPASGYSAGAAFWMELILTMGLVSVILGTASGAQNIGIIGAFGVGGYIALAGLWGSPISGSSMNPARTFGPDLVGTTFTSYWVYVAGPIAGVVLAVGIAFVLRGRGGDKSAAGAAQGDMFTEVYESGQS